MSSLRTASKPECGTSNRDGFSKQKADNSNIRRKVWEFTISVPSTDVHTLETKLQKPSEDCAIRLVYG